MSDATVILAVAAGLYMFYAAARYKIPNRPVAIRRRPFSSLPPEEVSRRRELRIQRIATALIERKGLYPTAALASAEQFVAECDRRLSAIQPKQETEP